MALLFQSNPDQWDLRRYLKPGGKVSWFVNRYLDEMKTGVLTLLWEAQGTKSKLIRGLYGWGITLAEATPDEQGLLRIPLQYVERWICAEDAKKGVLEAEQNAGIQAKDVLTLESWHDHLLNKMAIGTNFKILPLQLKELSSLVSKKYPESKFPEAVRLQNEGIPLNVNKFKNQYLREANDDK